MILINSSPKDTLKIFQPFLPVYVPIGIGYLLAACAREGIHAAFIDEHVEENTFELIAKYTKTMKRPYVFGLSVLTATFKRALFVSKRLKELYPDSFICFGGPHPTALPEEVLSYDYIDAVVRGEGEHILPELYMCVKAGRDFTHLENLSYRHKGRIVHNSMSSVIKDLDSIPPFPYHLFTSNRYELGFVISSRGCPYNCIFCSNRVTTGKKYRFRATESVVDELAMLHHKYGLRNIHFHDDNLLVNRARAYLLLDEITRRELHKKMTFSFQARGDNVDETLLKDMYAGGFRSVFFGIETASEKLMNILKKGETVEQCTHGVRLAKKAGFHVSATFIYGLPSETHEDRMDCIRLSKELDLDLVRYNNATPYPGTELYEITQQEGRLNIQGIYENFNSVATFIENPLKKIPFSYVPKGSSEGEIRKDILFSYVIFYLDSKKIKQLFSRPDQGVGWFSAGKKLRAQLKKLPALLLLGILLFVKFGELFVSILLKKNSSISIQNCIQFLSGQRFVGRESKEEK